MDLGCAGEVVFLQAWIVCYRQMSTRNVKSVVTCSHCPSVKSLYSTAVSAKIKKVETPCAALPWVPRLLAPASSRQHELRFVVSKKA